MEFECGFLAQHTRPKTRTRDLCTVKINRTRIVFKFGPTFRRPSKKTLRVHRQRQQQLHGKRMLQAGEIRTILEHATQPMKAMVLLGINGGLGASDLADLPHSAIDLENAWLAWMIHRAMRY